MPTFIDCHALTAIPNALWRQMYLEAKHELRDPHGVRTVGHWVERGLLYCILDAPDAVAACQHHIDRGLPCDQMQAIDDLDGQAPTSDEDRARVRATIARVWHSLAHRRLAELRRTLDETLDGSE